MKPLKPFVIEGKRYYHVSAAAKIVNVSVQTMWRWAADNMTSFGFELDVTRPTAPKRTHGRRPLKPRDFRVLIPEAKVEILKRLMHDFPLDPHGKISAFELDKLKRASRLYSRPQNEAAPGS
jgi:hypothetical protein